MFSAATSANTSKLDNEWLTTLAAANLSVPFFKLYVKIEAIPKTLHPASLKMLTTSIEEPAVEIKSSITTTFLQQVQLLQFDFLYHDL